MSAGAGHCCRSCMVTQGRHLSLSCVRCRLLLACRLLLVFRLLMFHLLLVFRFLLAFRILLACHILPPPRALCLLVASSHVVLVAHPHRLIGACSLSAHCRVLSPRWHLFLSACCSVSWSCCCSMLLLGCSCAVSLLPGCSCCAVLLLSCHSCPVCQQGGLGVG